MSDSSDNVVRLGGGGLLYEDAREQARQQAAKFREAEDLAPDPPPWSDQPEPEPEPEPKPAEPVKPSVVGVKKPPEPPKEPRSFREPISTALELVGIGLLITTGFLITVWLGTLIAGLCLVVLGVATSNQFSRPRN